MGIRAGLERGFCAFRKRRERAGFFRRKPLTRVCGGLILSDMA